MNKRRTFLFWLICLITNFAFSQIDTVFVPAFDVVHHSLREKDLTVHTLALDTSIQYSFFSQSIGDALQQNTSIFIRSYGLNSLSTLSVRGASTSQSLLLWNGIPIHSAMLGTSDLSLLPTAFLDKIELHQGGSSSAWGSSAIGGVLSMQNSSKFRKGFQLLYGSSMGSFKQLNQQLQFRIGTKKIQSESKVFYQNAVNDFSFEPYDGADKIYQENNAFKQWGFMQSFFYKHKNHRLDAHFWWQEVYKEIPPTIVQTKSVAFQEDRISRNMLNYQFSKKQASLWFKYAFFNENQQYNDELSLVFNHNEFQTHYGELSAKYSLNQKHQIEVNYILNYTSAQTEAYNQKRTQLRNAIVFNHHWEHKKHQILSQYRLAWFDNDFVPFTPSVIWQFEAKKDWHFHAKLSKDFRYPTLNDLYWQPGGNEELKPEQAWSQEIGINKKKVIKKHHFNAQFVLYNRIVNNWLLWKPGRGFWEAQNVEKVWSRGFELATAYQFNTNNFTWQISNTLQLNKSTFQFDERLPKIEKGQQIFYTPIWQNNSQISVQFKKNSIRYVHQVVGKTLGALNPIDAYHLSHIYFIHYFSEKKMIGNWFINLQNITNRSYTVIERRPMPGFYFNAGIQLTIQSQKQ